MKKLIYLSTILLMMVLTTGCVKYSYNIEIDKNNNVSVEKIQTIDASVFDAYDNEVIDKSLNYGKSKLEEDGYEVSVYEGVNEGVNKEVNKEDKSRGLKSKKVYKLDKVRRSDLPAGFKSNNKNFIETKSLWGIKDTYTIDWTYSVKEAISNSKYSEEAEKRDINIEELISSSGIKPQAELVIKIPYKSIHDNATSISKDNKELHWNLVDENNDSVHIILKYEKYNYNAIIGFIALLLAGVGFIILYKVLKRDDVVY